MVIIAMGSVFSGSLGLSPAPVVNRKHTFGSGHQSHPIRGDDKQAELEVMKPTKLDPQHRADN